MNAMTEMKQLYTPWTRNVDQENVLPEYPRPQLKRKDWVNLNGFWDYAFTSVGVTPFECKGIPAGAAAIAHCPFRSDGKILVPFSPESLLSGVQRQLQPDEILWYHRTFRASSRKTLLHFGAADQFAAVYVNGHKAGTHLGGYLPFTVDITPYLQDGENDLLVGIRDVSDTSYHARGKQKLQRGGMYYTATSGLWQTVWMETVPEQYIEEILVETLRAADTDTGNPVPERNDQCAPLRTTVTVRASVPGVPVKLRIFRPGIYTENEFSYTQEDVSTAKNGSTLSAAQSVERGNSSYSSEPSLLTELTVTSGTPVPLVLPKADTKLWSPEEPWLYYYTAEIVNSANTGIDSDLVTGYFALRTICVKPDETGIARIYLNGKPYFQRGVLDQSYWPDGLYTPPCDEAFVFDITEMKKTGFNMIRKHAKVEADRWYYHCDRLGLLVWQDMVNGGVPYKDWFVTYLATFTSWVGLHFNDSHRGMLSRENETGREEFERDMLNTVNALRTHPSIICWVVFNEGWGQFDTVRLTEVLRKADGTRLIDSASGWYDQGCGDFKSTHFYFLTYRLKPEKMRAAVLSEVGGYALHLPDHAMLEKVYGYRQDETKEALAERFAALIRWMNGLREKGLCGYVYTQVSDIEEEVNGIYTYDRAVRKIPENAAVSTPGQ